MSALLYQNKRVFLNLTKGLLVSVEKHTMFYFHFYIFVFLPLYSDVFLFGSEKLFDPLLLFRFIKKNQSERADRRLYFEASVLY